MFAASARRINVPGSSVMSPTPNGVPLPRTVVPTMLVGSNGPVYFPNDVTPAFPQTGGLVQIGGEVLAYQTHADGTFQVAINGTNGQPRTDALGNWVDATGKISWNQEKMFQTGIFVNQMEYQHVAIDQYARGHTPNIPLFVMYDGAVNADEAAALALLGAAAMFLEPSFDDVSRATR